MKILYLLPLLSFSLYCQTNLDHPTDEQIRNTDKIEISLTYTRDFDKEAVNMDSWFKIAKANDTFIEQCYAFPDDKDREFCEEMYKTIRFICDEHRSAQGIHRHLFVAGLTAQTKEDVIVDGQTFTVINTLAHEQADQLLALCNKQWWAQERTREEQDTILKNSLYLVLIDSTTQKIIGFIRAVTDYVRYAGIFDVIVDANYQGKGLGKLLVEKMLAHPKLSKISLITLHCLEDKVDFYEKCGFEKDFEKLVPMRLKRK